MIDYKIEATFTSDTELNEEQLSALLSSIALQIQEPQDLEGQDEEWKSSNITITGDKRWTSELETEGER
jgi:hypothetical protein